MATPSSHETDPDHLAYGYATSKTIPRNGIPRCTEQGCPRFTVLFHTVARTPDCEADIDLSAIPPEKIDAIRNQAYDKWPLLIRKLMEENGFCPMVRLAGMPDGEIAENGDLVAIGCVAGQLRVAEVRARRSARHPLVRNENA